MANKQIDWVKPGKIVELYCDGGVVGKNPSLIGGSWAWCGVNKDGDRLVEAYGFVPYVKLPVTNNHMEQIAIVLALEAMEESWSGKLFSDSMIALGRVFKGWRERNLPRNVSERTRGALRRLGRVQHGLLQGHPTKRDLQEGIGSKRGLPVSVHNAWCDRACNLAKSKFYYEGRDEHVSMD